MQFAGFVIGKNSSMETKENRSNLGWFVLVILVFRSNMTNLRNTSSINITVENVY